MAIGIKRTARRTAVRSIVAGTCVGVLACTAAPLAAQGSPALRRVTVEDSVLLRIFTARNYVDDATGEMALSPDGKRLVYALRETNLVANVNEVALYLLDIPARIGEPLPSLGRGREIFRSPALPLRSLFAAGRNTRSVQFQWNADGESILVLHQPAGEGFPVISRVSVDSGANTVVYRPQIEVTEFAADARGESIAVVGRAPTTIPGPLQSVKGIVLEGDIANHQLDIEYNAGKAYPYLHENQVRIRQARQREEIVFRTRPNRYREPGRQAIKSIRMSADGRQMSFEIDNPSSLLTYTREGAWAEKSRTSVALTPSGAWRPPAVSNDRVRVEIEQTPTTAPDLWVVELASGRKTRLTEVNPELHAQKMPRIERISIQGSYGVTSPSYLIYPIDYVEGRAYPAVLLLKHWNETFIHSAQAYYNEFPALQLSAAGMFVLMCEEVRPGAKIPAEMQGHPKLIQEFEFTTDILESAKKMLSAQGRVDPARVGLMSFSATVMPMKWALSRPSAATRPDWAAAIGIDGFVLDYVGYMRASSLFHRKYLQAYPGGPPFGESLKDWQNYAPTFNAHRVRTPVISVYHQETVDDADWVGALRAQGKPVEQIWFPEAGHIMQAPQSRRAWMHWAVDWMRFWLQGYERPNVDDDSDRYIRWRKLRAQHLWNERLIAAGKDPAEEFSRAIRDRMSIP